MEAQSIMMLIRRVRLAAAAAGFALMLSAALTGPASGDATVNGDAAAWREVVAAYGKLNTLSGYRMKTTGPGGGTMVIEVTAGGTAMHAMMQMQDGEVEVVRVGDQMRVRMDMPGAPAGWRCQGVPPVPRLSDPIGFQGTVDVARGPDVEIDGRPMHVYVYTLESSAGGAAEAVKTTLYVGVENGLPRRVALAMPRGDQAMDYYDYGAPIEIMLPSCGG